MLQTIPSEMPRILTDLARNKLVPFITGSPGIGKSRIVEQFAKENKLELIDIRLSQIDPTELNGFPMREPNSDRMTYAPLRMLPLEGDPLPKGKVGFCLLLDEFNAAPMSVQAAAYKVVLDRYIGNRKLHDRCITICAGNLQSDRSITNKLSTAMQSRLIHLQLKVSRDDWLKWAMLNGIDQRIISFIKFRKKLLHNFKPDHNDQTFPCPRTWEFTSKYISNYQQFNHTNLVVMAGCVSEGTAIEFKSFCEIYLTLPTLAEMIADPHGVKLRNEPSYKFALTTFLSHHLMEAPAELLIVIEKLPVELQVVTMREAYVMDNSMIDIPELDSWVDEHSDSLF